VQKVFLSLDCKRVGVMDDESVYDGSCVFYKCMCL